MNEAGPEDILSKAMPAWQGYDAEWSDEEARRMERLLAWQLRLRIDGRVSALDDTPVDGEEVYYSD